MSEKTPSEIRETATEVVALIHDKRVGLVDSERKMILALVVAAREHADLLENGEIREVEPDEAVLGLGDIEDVEPGRYLIVRLGESP